jgi:Ice-binding-like
MAQQNSYVINGQITFNGSLAETVGLQAQSVAGGLLIQLPNSTGLNQGGLLSAVAVNGNTVTLGFVAPPSSSIATSQLSSVEGTGGKVQLTTGVAASPVTSKLGSAAEYAILAYSGITNTGASVITGGNIGSAPTTGPQSGFTFTAPATIDNTNAGAARIAGNAAFAYYSALTPTQTGLANLSTNDGGGGAGVYHAGVFSGGALDIPTSITLDAQGVSSAVFVFISASTTILESGASIILANGAQASNVVWCVGSSFSQLGDNNTMVGNILAYTSITLDGGTLNGRALAVGGGNGAVTIAAAEAITATVGTGSPVAGDVVIYDGFGNVIDSGILLSSLGGAAGVTSFNGRSGAVVPTSGDYTVSQVTGAAPLASPTFTGTVTLPAGTYAISISGNAATATSATSATTAASAGALLNVVVSATAPTTGQVLTATSATAADWQTPSVGSGTVTSVSGAGIATGTVTTSGSITVLGSGSTSTAATADTNVATAPAGHVITSDGSGNVQDSGTSLAILATYGNSGNFTGSPTFSNQLLVTGSLILDGVTISQTAPTTGQVLTASSPTAAAWATPASSTVSSVFGRTGAVVAATDDYSFSQISGTLVASQIPAQGIGATFLSYDGGASTNGDVVVFNAAGTTTDSGIALSSLATQTYVTSQGYITSSALTPYALLSGATFTGAVQATTIYANVGLNVFSALNDGGNQPGVAGQFLASTHGSVAWTNIFQNATAVQAAAADSHTTSGTVTLAAGTATITLSGSAQFSAFNTYVVQLTFQSAPGGTFPTTNPILYVTSPTASGFTINSSDATDSTGVVGWTAVGF